MEDWLHPLNALLLQDAVRARRSKVKLDFDGTTTPMVITYNNTIDKLFIKPSDGLVPCGWFEIEKVLNPLFLERM